ncbi:MAG: murein L,D-transpeptidase catalytic domain family protein [Bacteroidota bacterium]
MCATRLTAVLIACYMLVAASCMQSCAQPARAVVAAPDTAAYFRKAKALTTEDYFLYVDLSLPSYTNRFFVLDLKNRKVLMRGLCCSGKTKNGKTLYANTPGSNCSSKGLYKIGARYFGRFGEAYKLHGLDATNSNALKRYVVLHSHPYVPEKPCTEDIVISEGCPTLNPNVFKKVSEIVRKEQISYLFIQ